MKRFHLDWFNAKTSFQFFFYHRVGMQSHLNFPRFGYIHQKLAEYLWTQEVHMLSQVVKHLFFSIYDP